MLNLTKQERLVLVVLVVVFLFGTMMRYAFKKYPELKDIVNLLDSDTLYPKVDINTASLEELMSVPYIGKYTAGNIVDYRRGQGDFSSIKEVMKVKGIRKKNYDIFSKYLTVY